MTFLKTIKNLNVGTLSRAGLIGVLSSTVAIISGAPVYASEGALVLEEIIVTARKKDESIQDVPLAVTAITGQLKEG
ncbi:MAG: hypothetical protein P8N63_07620, partial [Pseudomonadales bacterium]|nr:hypothetical protein [Pseudomonadales bacterium]